MATYRGSRCVDFSVVVGIEEYNIQGQYSD